MPEPGGHGQEPGQQAQGEDHDADLDQHSRIRQVHWYDWGLSGIRIIRTRGGWHFVRIAGRNLGLQTPFRWEVRRPSPPVTGSFLPGEHVDSRRLDRYPYLLPQSKAEVLDGPDGDEGGDVDAAVDDHVDEGA